MAAVELDVLTIIRSIYGWPICNVLRVLSGFTFVAGECGYDVDLGPTRFLSSFVMRGIARSDSR